MCASAAVEFFHCPAYKLMISDIRSATSSNPQLIPTNGESIQDLEQAWVLSLNEVETKKGKTISLKAVNPSKPCVCLDLNLIWIQGTVLKIKSSETGNESLVITDDEKELDQAVIYEYNTVPGGDHESIKIGSYVGALGQVWANKPEVVIKATKIMYLSDKPMCQSIWKDEVNYGKAFLAGLISPKI